MLADYLIFALGIWQMSWDTSKIFFLIYVSFGEYKKIQNNPPL